MSKLLAALVENKPGANAAIGAEYVARAKPDGYTVLFGTAETHAEGKLNFASWGNGSTAQIAFEQIKQVTGMKLEHVPFQGAAPAITAVAAGDVQAFAVPLSVARPQAASGRVKIVAVISEKREAAAPEIPTATEQGVPVVISGWHILAVPAGTPADVIARLNKALNAANARPEVKEKLAKAGVKPALSSVEEAQAMVKQEHQRWGEVARKAGLHPG